MQKQMIWNFFAQEIGSIEYEHNIDFAPTKELLSQYRKKEITWDDYEIEYLNLLDLRKVAQKVEIKQLHKNCLLCSEHTPEYCHRRLLAEYLKNVEYLYLRSKILYINKLYYIALDTLLIATEFEEKDKIYNLISKIYNFLGNKELSKKIASPELRLEAVNSLKKELTGISQKGYTV